MKSCQTEGKISLDKLHFVLKRPEMILSGYGVAVEAIHQIEISTKAGSGTCYCYNEHKDLKSFQIGVYLATIIFLIRPLSWNS
jgi:hypothetical protein